MTGSLLVGVGCWCQHGIGAKVSMQKWNMSAVDMKLPEVQLFLLSGDDEAGRMGGLRFLVYRRPADL